MNIGQKKGKPKVVLDSNVIISGLNFKGNPRKILNLVLLKEVELYVSPFILKEVAEVLERKLDWDEGRNEYQGIKILSPAEFLKLLTIIE